MVDKRCLVAGCIFCSGYLIFLIIILLVGIYSRLDPVIVLVYLTNYSQLLYGLTYDQLGFEIKQDELWTGGRHPLGMGLEFLKFPRSF